MLGWPALSVSYLPFNHFWCFKQHCPIGHSCVQMLPRSLYVLPFRLYSQPAYPPLMELLKSRYEQNLGGPAFVNAHISIRWEHDDKNLSNACRSCPFMHNNLWLCGWRKNTFEAGEKGFLKRVVINMYKARASLWQTWMINIAQHSLSNRQIKVLFAMSGAIYRLIRYLCEFVRARWFEVNKDTSKLRAEI